MTDPRDRPGEELHDAEERVLARSKGTLASYHPFALAMPTLSLFSLNISRRRRAPAL